VPLEWAGQERSVAREISLVLGAFLPPGVLYQHHIIVCYPNHAQQRATLSTMQRNGWLLLRSDHVVVLVVVHVLNAMMVSVRQQFWLWPGHVNVCDSIGVYQWQELRREVGVDRNLPILEA
jgi:hypothetical protein